MKTFVIRKADQPRFSHRLRGFPGIRGTAVLFVFSQMTDQKISQVKKLFKNYCTPTNFILILKNMLAQTANCIYLFFKIQTY